MTVNGKYISMAEASELTGLHPNTLRKYANEGTVHTIRTTGNHRRFLASSLPGQSTRKAGTVCYCRVSSRKQQDDLARQVSYMRTNFPEAEIIKDIGSGLNYKRKGLRSLLERLMRGDRITLIVAYKDRLARFGFDLIEHMVEQNGGEIMVLNQLDQSPEQELVSDICSIINVFSCRLHGLRRYGDSIKKDQSLSQQGPKADD